MSEKKTIHNSSFRTDQKIELEGADFLMADLTIDTLLNSMGGYCLPERYRFIDPKTGEPFEGIPTKEQLEKDEVRKIFDPAATFTHKNLIKCFKFASNYPQDAEQELQALLQVMEFKRRLIEFHDKEAQAGRTTFMETLIEEEKKKQEMILTDVTANQESN